MTAALSSYEARRQAVREYVIPVLSGILIVFGAAYPILTLGCFFLNILYVIFADSKSLFKMLFVLLPFAQIYKVSALGGTSFFTYLEVLVVVVYIFKMQRFQKKFLTLFVVWVLYVFLGCELNILMWVKQLMIPFLIYIFFHNDHPSFKEVIISLVIGLILSSVLALFKEQIPNLADMIRSTRVWEAEGIVYRFSGTYPDPNYYTLVIILCAASMLIMFSCRRMGWEAIVLLAVLIYFGAQTASKSFLLMLGAVGVLFVMSMFVNKRNTEGVLLAIVLCIAAVFVLSGEIEIFSNVLLRLEASADNMTTGRMENWGRYFSYFNRDWLNWILGSGINAGYLYGIAAHNTYIDLIYYYGVCGTGIFLVTCINAAGETKNRPALGNYIPLLCLMAMNMFLSSVDFFDFAFNLILVLYAFQTDFSKTPQLRSP